MIYWEHETWIAPTCVCALEFTFKHSQRRDHNPKKNLNDHFLITIIIVGAFMSLMSFLVGTPKIIIIKTLVINIIIIIRK